MDKTSDGADTTRGDDPITRRTMLLWGGALAAAAITAASRAEGTTSVRSAPAGAAGGALAAGGPALIDARTIELYMKLHAASADGEVPWYYTGRIYAVREREAPRHLCNYEGTEIYWVRRTGEAEWTTMASTLTFYRDAVTGQYLDSYANPFTGRTVPVSPNVLRSAPGKFSRLSVGGHELTTDRKIPWSIETHCNGGILWLMTSRYLALGPQPWLEVQSMMAAESDLVDARNTRPAATFSSSYLAPWLRWMEMGDAPGHVLWHSAGRKLASLAELPDGYRARAERVQPGHFVAPPGL